MNGSLFWMSPEAIEGGKIDPKTDMWSLAITAIELAIGFPPFDPKKNLMENLKKIKNGQVLVPD